MPGAEYSEDVDDSTRWTAGHLTLELSIVIPSFNEATNISKVIDDSSGVCDRLAIDYEIVVYDTQID